ncbi:uncharacterized protein LOC111271249 isoform X1 [Varroa jacobsoni]|uniref:uncharacterized protein LOC111271249 isoform X1 n=1 Tax=Varroa jacobsoni TaxID=62625 RepID=UPI000BF738DF|nr:uncharacterized protein LOC111271249 isoform X1 [Varroa jacobsoni]
MAHPVVKFAEILALIFLFASVLSIIWAKDLPKTVKCLDKLCEGSQGETIAPHAVPSDHDLKLSFEESDHLQILGNADKYYLAKDLKTGKVGLVSKTFVKKFDESPHATIEVDLSSLLAERQNVASALQPSPTSDRLCVVDGTTLDGDVCKDPVSTQYTVTVRPNARVAENDDGLKEDERPHEASSSFKPTPGIEDLPASSAPSAESNSFSRNIFQKVYQEFIAPFGQEIELSEVDCGAECLLNTGAIAQDLDGKSAGSAPKTSYNLPSNAVQTKATGTTSKGISVDETRIANRLETNISSYNIVNDEVNVNASIAAAAASVSPDTENSDEGKSPKLSTGGDGSENFASDQAIRPEAKKVEKTADTDNNSVTADQPLKPDFNGEKAENPAQNVVTGPLLATAPEKLIPQTQDISAVMPDPDASVENAKPGSKRNAATEGVVWSDSNVLSQPGNSQTGFSEEVLTPQLEKNSDGSNISIADPAEHTVQSAGDGDRQGAKTVTAKVDIAEAIIEAFPSADEAQRKPSEPLLTSKDPDLAFSNQAAVETQHQIKVASSSPREITQSQKTPKLEPVVNVKGSAPNKLQPKVVVGQTHINPTKVNNFKPPRTRTTHGHFHRSHLHSHGGHEHFHSGHGHSHNGHEHSYDTHGHGNSHEVGNEHSPPRQSETLLLQDPFKGHSYIEEKPDTFPALTETKTYSKVVQPGIVGETPSESNIHPDSGSGLAVNAVANDKPAPVSDNGQRQQNPVGEPSEYTVNTLEQTCERKDGVSCDGGPAVPLGQEKHVKLQSAEDEATKSARAKKRRRQDDTLDSAIREYVGLVLSVIPDPLHRLLWDLEEQGVSTHVVVLTFLCGLVGSFLLIFFNCISMNSKEGTLSDYIARLEQQLFALKKEREILLETKDTGHGLVVGTTGGDQALPNELIEHHERELEMILARANNVEQEVQQLQEQIEQVKAERDAYSDDVNEKLQEYEKELSELRFDVETSRREVERKDRELQVKNGTLSELQASNAELLEEAKIWDERVNELTSREEINLAEMSKLQQLLEEKCAEVEALEESLKSMNIFEKAQEAFSDGDEKEIMKRLVDVQRAQKQSEELMSMNTTLQSELTEAKKQCDRWRTEVDQLKECLQQAEKDKRDSEQKLTVLTEYFKDKELKLQRDVVMHETLRQQKESDALTVSEQLDLYREQTANLQAEVASMKEEIEVSERRYKRHLMEQEKKTHENWMAFKNANKTIEDLNAETQVLRQQIIAAEAAQRTLTQAAALPQDRPRPPPPLPLPKGAQIPLLPLPLLNGLKASEMPSPPSARYTNGARCTPPVGVVPLPTVLYQTKSSSSRHSSERKDHQSHRRREDDHEEGRSERKSRGDKAIDRSEPHRDRNRNRETAERRRERKEQQMLLEREKASPANSASITSGEQQQQSRRGANKASELDRDPSTPSVVGIADSSGICGGSTVKENGSASNGRSVHSGGSKGGVISPELRRTFAHRRSDRTDRGRADCYDRNERNQGDLGDRPNRDYGERSPRDNPRR